MSTVRGQVLVCSNGMVTVRPENSGDLRRFELGDVVELSVAERPSQEVDPIAGYAEWDRDDLVAEVAARKLIVTRSDGRDDLEPRVADLVAALEAADA